jgi:asparagine synthase (glutamine-hydrolysing)
MCGIVGSLAVETKGGPIEESTIIRMRDVMTHRGPDGAGAWVSPDRRVGLGHRRLSIIDLSDAAGQPMSNSDGSLWIVFNGEIYNHAEIRAELEGIGGHHWKTDHSDTEVILNAFREWGIDCLDRFRGMFAFALWDARQHELWLVRDRIGIKPLYFAMNQGRLSFASEIKALLEDPIQPRAIDEESLFHFLEFMTCPSPKSLFQGIQRLSPGTWLRIRSSGDIEERRYWDVLEHTESLASLTENEVAERVLAGLENSVELRKVSDVPVGVFLSGGIDSSTNAALFSRRGQEPVSTFTIGYQGDGGGYENENDIARSMAESIGADHHELLLSQDDLLSFVPRMVELQDEPIADPVCVPVHYVSKLARDAGVPVCQVGEGADELFWGYPGWKLVHTLSRWNDLPVPRFAKRMALGGMKLAGKDETLPYEWLRRGANGLPIFWTGSQLFTEPQKQRLLSQRMRRDLAGLSSWDAIRPIHQRFEERAWEPSHLNWMTYLDLNLRLPELLLMRVDKMSMGNSLETRVPFLDHEFVALAMSIPSALKTKNGTLKHILKKSVRGLIPDEIIDRPKQGFGVPLDDWFRAGLSEHVREEIRDFCAETDYFDEAIALRLVDSGDSRFAWFLFNLALWWKRFIR